MEEETVPGEGPVPSERMIIGEAPGSKEVEMGRPFVGKSGILLGTALKELGLRRDDIYVTNVVKFHPQDESSKTRPPTFKECSWAYHNELMEEITRVRPAKSLALGKTAQRWGGVPGVGIMVKAWHPAYVLRNGGYGSDVYKLWFEQLRPFAEDTL